MHIEDIEYEADGRRMVGTLAVDEYQRGLRPCVLLCHEGPGLDEHVRGRAVRLASLGYLAFALDYHGDGVVMAMDEYMAALGRLMADRSLTQEIGRAGLDVLLSRPEADATRVAAFGYCFGGIMALELARAGAPLAAVVGFHPGAPVPAPDASRNITGSVLMCWGAADPFVPAEARQGFAAEMAEAGVADWRIELYGGVGHSFTNQHVDDVGVPGLGYDAKADRRSWRSALTLLEETLGPT